MGSSRNGRMVVRSKFHDAARQGSAPRRVTSHFSRLVLDHHCAPSLPTLYALIHTPMSTTSSEDSSTPPPSVAIAGRLRYILSSVLLVPVDGLKPDTQLSTVGVDPLSAFLLAGLAAKAGLPLSYADVISTATFGKLEALVQQRIEAADADVWMEEHYNSHPFSPPESSS